MYRPLLALSLVACNSPDDPTIEPVPVPVCLPDGTCVMSSEVAYADSDAPPTETACSKDAPCPLSTAVNTGKQYIVLRGDFTEPIVISGRTLWLLAEPGTASLTRLDSGAVLSAKQHAMLSLYGITMSGAVQIETIGISADSSTVLVRDVTIAKMSGLAIDVTGGGLTLTGSTIMDNRGGGVRVTDATFQITEDAFIGNGTQQTPLGAISISTKPSSQNQLESCTISGNMAQDGVGAAVDCYAGPFVGQNNQISGNGNGNDTGSVQITGSCIFQ